LNAVPGLLAQGDYVRVLRDIIEDMQNLGRSGGFDQVLEKICARIACHSVIRGIWLLALQEVTSLFAQLDKTEFSGNCPHGRPVLRKLTISEIEKMFKRG
jgi:DNA mismatch repair protein MutL